MNNSFNCLNLRSASGVQWKVFFCKCECSERNGYFAEIFDEAAVEVGKPYKSLELVSGTFQSLMVSVLVGSALTCLPFKMKPRNEMEGTWNSNFLAFT